MARSIDNLEFCENRREGRSRTKNFLKRSSHGAPLVSVITVVMNGEKHLEDTILSVLNQTYPNVEYIIIDGGSTDGTIDIIKKYQDRIAYWVSEKDLGLYDAMNKGINRAKGELIHILNADDMYYSEKSLETFSIYYNENDEQIIAADTILISEEGKEVAMSRASSRGQLYYRIPFMHPSCVIPRKIYVKYDCYDLKYKIASDVDLIMKVMKGGGKITAINEPLVKMRRGGISDLKYFWGRFEYFQIYMKYYRNIVAGAYGFLRSMLGYIIYKVSGKK